MHINGLLDLYINAKEKIKDQDTEINKLNNVIDIMAEALYHKDAFGKFGNTSEKVKEYFMKENN